MMRRFFFSLVVGGLLVAATVLLWHPRTVGTVVNAGGFDRVTAAHGEWIAGITSLQSLDQSPGESITLGLLEYIPRPDISICFCGSYFLRGDEDFESCYLFADDIDLSDYVGEKVLVSGKRFSRLCEGTLASECSCMTADKIVTKSNTGTFDSEWGLIKLLYR